MRRKKEKLYDLYVIVLYREEYLSKKFFISELILLLCNILGKVYLLPWNVARCIVARRAINMTRRIS